MLPLKTQITDVDSALGVRNASAETGGARLPALKILWVTGVDYAYGIEHGGHLRLFSLARELVSIGHEVYFAVCRKATDDPLKRKTYLDELKREGVITGYFELQYEHPALLGKLAHMALYPPLSNYLLREAQASVKRSLKGIIVDTEINLCILSDRSLLFALPEIEDDVTTIVDWVDSFVLYQVRDIGLRLKKRQLRQAAQSLRHIIDVFVAESYYGKRCAANLVVSPVDKSCLDRVNRSPQKNRVLLNGVSGGPAAGDGRKIKNRIIFTGNMDFPPNYESAIWFIDHVLPLLLERQGDIKLVIAGANPVNELLMRAGRQVEVTGYVEDMRREIASSELYVAPLVCGGGFKNKIVEAITSGTFVVATSLGVEFLKPEMRDKLLVADKPEQMVEVILAYLENPQKFEPELAELRRLIDEELSWEHQARELAALAYETLGGRLTQPMVAKNSYD